MILRHLHQVPVAGLNQTLRFFRFDGGIGIVIWGHEFSVRFGGRGTEDTAREQQDHDPSTPSSEETT